MAKRRRRAKIPTPAWEKPRGAIGRRVIGRSSQFYGAVLIALLLVAGLGIVAYAFAADELEERRRPGSTAVSVDDARFRLDYFSRRLQMYVAENGGLGADGTDPLIAIPAVSDLLVGEEIVRRFAGELDVIATEAEVEAAIRSRLGVADDVANFDVIYQQELGRTGLSDEEYRAMVLAAVLRDKLVEKFLEEVPDSAESVRYQQILVATREEADAIKRAVEDGTPFRQLAAERSLDAATRDNAGRVGWVPPGVLGASFEELVFALEPDQVDVIPAPEGVFVIRMLEKDEDRPIEDAYKQVLAQRALAEWIDEKRASLNIVSHIDGDQEKRNWAIEQAYSFFLAGPGG